MVTIESGGLRSMLRSHDARRARTPSGEGRGVTFVLLYLPDMSVLTHFDSEGQAHMVDVSAKLPTARVAVAAGRICMAPDTLALIREGRAGKGDVLGVARIAAIQGAKRTADLIPLCHPLSLSRVAVHFEFEASPPAVRCEVTAQTVGPTGVEMEALTAVQVGLLTIYDMCKAADKGMLITDVGLMEKQGGKSGPWRRNQGSTSDQA